MRTSSRFLPALAGVVFLLGFTTPVRAADDLADRIKALITGPDYRHSRWGILVVDSQDGRPVFEHNADQLFVPASVTKVYSCAAALVAFGPDHKFETPVYRRGTVEDGRLHGDLILVASGDLTLGGRADATGKLAFKDHDHIYAFPSNPTVELTDTDPLAGLKNLARQIKEAGIRHVEGNVLVDDRLFARSKGSGSGPDVLSPIHVNDDVVDLEVRPADKEGEPATVTVRPQTDYVQIDARADTVAQGKPAHLRTERVGPERYRVRGEVPAKGKPLVGICPVDDPAGFARALLIETLRREGVKVEATVLRKPPATALPDKSAYKELPRVALHTSEPFSEVLKVTLKVSHNLYASTFPLLLAARKGQRTLAEGMRVEHDLLQGLGVDVASVTLESGAGGGNGDRVTPRATVQLLRAMAARPDYPAFKAALPVLGVDGTLADVVDAASPARGKVQAKTGTYGDPDLLNGRVLLRSKALAGVLTTAKGRPLTFSIFVNDVPLAQGVDHTREGKMIGKLCEVLYQHAP